MEKKFYIGENVTIDSYTTRHGITSADGIIDRAAGNGYMVTVLDIKLGKPVSLYFDVDQIKRQ